MKSKLEKLLSQFEAMRDQAEEKAGSESEKTSGKYGPVYDALSDACGSLEEAIGALEG